jgi:glucosamine--fructose-6-phosphate aminotransferase (isomerizing)
MCGIVGFAGNGDITDFLLDGLTELEYRGYDSSGIAVLSSNEPCIYKSIGKLQNLRDSLDGFSYSGDGIAIGHTRWATHGKPTDVNAHPHQSGEVFVVHNGIVENYKEIKSKLQNDYKFISQTDSEAIPHLYNYYIEDKKTSDEFSAFKNTIKELDGSFALLLADNKNKKMFFSKKGSPLMYGKKDGNIFFASSESPLIGHCEDIFYFEDGDYGYVFNGEIKVYRDDKEITPIYKKLAFDKLSVEKDGFDFFMQKEIYEQSEVSKNTMSGRVVDTDIVFDELSDSSFFDDVDNIIICACGTSYHAGLTVSYLFERLSGIYTSVEVASEFRYKSPVVPKNSLFIVISQSGETADTLEALKMIKKQSVKTLAICNVDNSSITRESDFSIMTRAGVEKGVASTKAFSTQVLTLWMLCLFISKRRDTLSTEQFNEELEAIKTIPKILAVNSNTHEKIKRLSKRYLHGHGFFFIGRDVFYPLALEGALKLKEISYLHAEGYPAGEMKHGPIALVDSELFTISLLPKNMLYAKTKSNIEELGARDSTICVISPEHFDLMDDFIRTVHYDHYMQEFFEMTVVLQLLSMEIALRLNNDIDMPRNLAKSVTVE